MEACLTSDLDEGAKVLWAFLFAVKGGGMGTPALARVLQMSVRDIETAIEVLKERGVIRRQNGTWRASVFEVSAEAVTEPEEQVASKSPAHAAAIGILSHYDEVRDGQGFGKCLDPGAALVNFRRLAVWLHETGVKFDRFLEWSIERTAFMRERMAFPSPSLLAGPWLRGEWLNRVDGRRRDSASATTGHAGRSYREPSGLKTRLQEAGFERARNLGKAELRHILEWAENMAALPEHFDAADPKYEGEITWLRDRILEEDERAAGPAH